MNQLLINFSEKYNLYYILDEDEDKVYIKAKDFGELLKLNSIIRNYNETQKKTFITSTNGGNQTCNFISLEGIKKLISSSNKINVSKIADELKIEKIINLYNPPIEVITLDYIIKFIENERYIHQYKVKKYKIDLFLIDYNIAIECYENYHNTKKQKEYDEKRIKEIKEEIGCTFIIYHPQMNEYNIIENCIKNILDEINNFKIMKKLNNQIKALKLENENLKRENKLLKENK